MDAQTEELRHAHDVLADWYAERLVGLLESMPIERAVLDLFSELTLAAGLGAEVADVGRTAYPRFKWFLSARELHVFYTPQPEEIAWAGAPWPTAPGR